LKDVDNPTKKKNKITTFLLNISHHLAAAGWLKSNIETEFVFESYEICF